ncbi:restriction endonuclease subunit S [Chryseobacterium sp. P1-3]|uniref:restriction endonuclease subunit S n=1 Tax=Chryseobacterium sp. (strain P1-3) TaxID=1517683 RepID=UPI000678A849|nr:restriction endonuclease subunit S [Chryseobacterium sp. P1-3]
MTNKKLNVVNVPNLRFPGFKGEWETRKLGEIGDVKMCKRIFSNETSITGEIPFFKIGSFGKEADAFISKELYLDYKKRFSFPKKGDILISASGTVGRTVVYNGEDAYFQDSNIVWIDNDNTNITNEFLYYILQIVKYNTEGGTIQRLYNNILKSTKFNSPSISEQQKIASFLSLLDERISTQNKIIEELKSLKNTLRYQLFEQITNEITEFIEIRDILNYEQPNKYLVTDIDYSSDDSLIPVLTANKAFILGYTNENFGIYDKGGCIIFDDFTMDIKFVDFPFKVKSSAIKILTAKTDVNLKFIFEYLSFLVLSSNEHKRHYISEIEPMQISLPEYHKQSQVSNILSGIDEKIKNEFKINKLLIKQKQYFLANLFI